MTSEKVEIIIAEEEIKVDIKTGEEIGKTYGEIGKTYGEKM